jgi:hypothetical protein
MHIKPTLDEIAKEKDLKDWNKIKPQKRDEESNRTLDAIKHIVLLAFFLIGQSLVIAWVWSFSEFVLVILLLCKFFVDPFFFKKKNN